MFEPPNVGCHQVHGFAARMVVAAILLVALGATGVRAQTTNALSDAESQGLVLARKILAQGPAQNLTNRGTLEIRDEAGQRRSVPVVCETLVTKTNWLNRYVASLDPTNNSTTVLVVEHAGAEPNHYFLSGKPEARGIQPAGNQTMAAFAGSDFWLCDLGLEFFHWPRQKVVKKEFHRQCPCTVLESTNPNPAPGAYSRVDCWIDNDSLGIVEAYAYDANGRRLKNFYPKNLEKVNGQYQVESMVMDNLQAGSRTVLEFDLK
jgi:hypothetical protein